MGDNLPELLYRAFCDAAGLAYGTDATPGFHNLPTEQRYAWEKVAAKAKHEMHERFVRDMRDATAAHGAEQAIANLLEAATN